MEILRTATNPWGEGILVGIAWDLMWAALFIGVIFVVAHAIWVAAVAPKPAPAAGPDTAGAGAPAGAGPAGAGLPDRIERHSAASRSFHWLMAVAMFVLLITAFFPVVGIQFAWVQIHWIAGIALTALIVWHIVHSLTTSSFGTIWIGREQIAERLDALRRFFRREPDPDPRTGKYPTDQRAFHNAAMIVSLGVIVTGILMMFRIDTWFWRSNPYFLSDATWGLVFVLHGLCGVALITLTVAHVYFAIRPEKRWMTRSMIKGWITREEYVTHYDPAKWPVGPEDAAGAVTGGGGAAGGRNAEPGADRDAVAPA